MLTVISPEALRVISTFAKYSLSLYAMFGSFVSGTFSRIEYMNESLP